MGARGQRPAEDNPSCGDKRVSWCHHRDHSTRTVAEAGTRCSGGKLWQTITTSTNIITKVRLLKAGIFIGIYSVVYCTQFVFLQKRRPLRPSNIRSTAVRPRSVRTRLTTSCGGRRCPSRSSSPPRPTPSSPTRRAAPPPPCQTSRPSSCRPPSRQCPARPGPGTRKTGGRKVRLEHLFQSY